MTRLRTWPPPPQSPDEAGAAGPGLPGWQPLPDSPDPAPAPVTSDPLSEGIERDIALVLQRCAVKLVALEAQYVPVRQRYRTALRRVSNGRPA